MAKRKYTIVTAEVLKTLHLRKRGTFRAYKVSMAYGSSPDFVYAHPVLTCAPGAVLEVKRAVRSRKRDCAAGVNVATREWCKLTYYGELVWGGYRLWFVEFEARDIASVPINTEGKFRLFRCRVIRQVKVE